jgi:hypothetical protein
VKQLILVVGTLKTDHWAIAVTSHNEVAEHISFTVSSAAGTTLWGKWSKSVAVSRSGPMDLRRRTQSIPFRSTYACLALTEDNEPNKDANQTLFIRRISLRSEIALGKKKWTPSFPQRTLIQRLYTTLIDADESQKRGA